MQNQLSEMAGVQAMSVRLSMAAAADYLETVALVLRDAEDLLSDSSIDFLTTVCDGLALGDLVVIRADGEFRSVKGGLGSLETPACFPSLLEGKASVGQVLPSITKGRASFTICAPVMRQGMAIGALGGVYYTSSISEILETAAFEGEGYSFVFQKNGEFVARAKERKILNSYDDIWTMLAAAQFSRGYSYEETAANVEENNSGFMVYTLPGDDQVYVRYAPVGINDWYIANVVPTAVTDKYITEETTNAARLTVAVLFAMVLFMLLALWVQRRDGLKIHKAHDQLRLSDERFKLAMSKVAMIIYEYDVEKDELDLFNFDHDKKNQIHLNKALEFLHSSEVIHQQSRSGFFQSVRDIMEKGATISDVHRLKLNDDAEHRWYRLTMTAVFNDKSRHQVIIGTIEDINETKCNELALRRRAERDPLTRLFNRATTQELINEFIFGGGIGAFIVLDLDGFKEVNDKYGHITGDNTLTEISKVLTKMFRDEDIIGRLGGDEFIIFVKGIETENSAVAKAARLNTNLTSALGESLNVSCSSGVTLTRKGDTFKTLYERADKALYQAKAKGKSTTVFYHDE